MKISRKSWYYIGAVAAILFLFGNSGSRTVIRRYWDMNKLKAELEELKKENNLLKKEVYLLENDTSYVEQIARKELNLISKNEIEYRFKK